MKKLNNLEHKLAHLLDIPNDVVFDLPKITLIGNIQLYIENHKGIIEYLPSVIRIAVNTGEVEVTGEELTVRNINREEIHLDGLILSIRFNR